MTDKQMHIANIAEIERDAARMRAEMMQQMMRRFAAWLRGHRPGARHA